MNETSSNTLTPGLAQALVRLLDDPSPTVQGALMAELARLGEPATILLRQIAEEGKPAQAEAAQRILRKLGAEDTRGAFLRFIRSTRYELETGCILLDRTLYPKVEPELICGLLDQIAARVKQLLVKPATPVEQCRVLNRVLFHEYGFRGDQEDFYHPHNCLLHKVIERRRGLPISLAIIYLLVAYRCGINLEPIGLPGRFVVGCFTSGEPFYIDVFEGGAFRSRADLEDFLENFELSPDDSYFMPISTGEVLLRCCRNLVNQFTRAHQMEKARLFASYVQEFESIYQGQN